VASFPFWTAWISVKKRKKICINNEGAKSVGF